MEFSSQINLQNSASLIPKKPSKNLLRFIPDIKYSNSSNNEVFDFQATGNFWLSSEKITEKTSNAEFYRLWAKISNDSTEFRLGLQKINFGTAKILRSLKWFDQIDPQDPTGFTTGVKGLLVRHYFNNDSNLWLWSLYGNKNPTGSLPLKSNSEALEFGGRYQFPISSSEMAFSVHKRNLESNALPLISTPGKREIQEKRVGFDSQWDFFVGLWLEASLSNFETKDKNISKYLLTTAGIDYTFNLGQGIYLALELQNIDRNPNTTNSRHSNETVYALNQSYSLGILDNISSIIIGDFKNRNLNTSIDFQRIYDSWVVNLGIFYKQALVPSDSQNIASFENKVIERGGRITVQINI